jgi:hypothetical protein
VAAGANASQVIANADDNTFFEVTLGTPPTVTFGQRLAICINWAASGNMQLSSVPGANAWILTSGGTALFTGSWAFGTNTWGVGCVRYDDTTYPRISGMFPITTITTTNLASNTTPDERATKFVPPYDCKIAGGQVMITTGSWADGEDYDLVLYDSGGSSLASVSVTGGVGIAAPRVGLFSTPVTVAAGSTYRLAVKPTTTNAFQISQYTWATNARGNAPGVTSWTADSSTRTDAGSWTDDTATGHNIIPILSAVDDGTGAGAQQYGFPAGS